MSFFLLVPASRVLAQQTDSSRQKIEIVFAPALRGINLYGTTFFFNRAYGGLVDLDILGFSHDMAPSLGFRFGVDRYAWGTLGGLEGEYLDYDALARLTVSREHFRFDLIGGYVYRIDVERTPSFTIGGTKKFGIEFRWKIVPRFFGLLVKLTGHDGGLGLFGGWEQ